MIRTGRSGVGDILITGVLAVIALTLLALFMHLRGLREDLVHELRLRDITINSLEMRAGGRGQAEAVRNQESGGGK